MIGERSSNVDQRFLLDDHDAFADDVDELLLMEHEQLSRSRYAVRQKKYRKRSDRWQLLLHDREYLNDTEFLSHFRVSRDAFSSLLALIKDDDVFQPAAHRTFRGPAELHLMVLLKFLGIYGNENTAPKLALFLGIGKGSVANYTDRTMRALLKIRSSVITWPDQDERQEISSRIKDKYEFVNCVGMVDGTLLPLEFKPAQNGEDYFCRKGSYAINALLTCNNVARIRDFVVGWPGSVHNNRVWSNCRLKLKPSKYFIQNQYVLGDSAFQASTHMVPAYKKPPRSDLDPHKSFFNIKLAKARIKTEHCIGLLKARFQYFKGVRVIIRSKADMKKIIKYFTTACILHNLLIREPVPAEWEQDIKCSGLGEDDKLNSSIPNDSVGDERRNQLLCYLLEIQH